MPANAMNPVAPMNSMAPMSPMNELPSRYLSWRGGVPQGSPASPLQEVSMRSSNGAGRWSPENRGPGLPPPNEWCLCLLSGPLHSPCSPASGPAGGKGPPGLPAFSDSGPTPSGAATALMTSWTGQAIPQRLQNTGTVSPAPGPRAESPAVPPARHPRPCPAAGAAVWAAWGQPPMSRSAPPVLGLARPME